MPSTNASPSAAAFGFGTPFQAQIDYLRNKLNLPTEKWDDITRAAHDKAFIVAGAAKADLLDDLHQAVIRSASEGRGFQVFQRDFKALVAKHGWTGWTGEGSAAGEAWRARIIYQTNMSTSYWAGRYQQMTNPEVLKLHPYWRYIHSDTVLHPRPLHLAWHGLTLRWDHPFWQAHFPPNGWGCQCRIISVTQVEGEASARAGLGEPPEGWDQVDAKTGEQVGIDKSFGYAPGASVKKPLQEFIDNKLMNLDAPIGAQMWEVLKPVLLQERLAAWQAVFDATRQTMQAGAAALQVHTVEAATVANLAQNAVVLENSAVWMRDTELLHALRATKTDRGAVLPDSVWRDLPLHLEAATPYLDTLDKALIYAIDLGSDIGKVVMRVNYNEKGQFSGVRAKIVSNFIQSGGLVEPNNIALDARYTKLKK